MHLSDIGKKKSYSILVGKDIWLPRDKLAKMLKVQFDEYKQFLKDSRGAEPHETIVTEFEKLIDTIMSDKKELKKVDANFKLLYDDFESLDKLGIKWQVQILDF
ncbi:hypothetical protein VmeM32_00213 [Vibrio phage vB_VmeM-32]|nr:hypothetical protein VmeM32_00213 [Vibrio phage vB_VmeM-32]